MRFLSFHLLLFLGLLLENGACQSSAGDSDKKNIGSAGLITALDQEKTRGCFDALHFYLAEHYADMSATERQSLREALKTHLVWSFDRICPVSEPGDRIRLKGRLTGPNGEGLAGVFLHTFQADAQGFYAPSDATTGKMAENDPRLEGFLITDSTGAFELHTIRPASYPKKYEGRLIPQHIHILANAPGYQETSVQVVFENDPAMSEHWIQWATAHQFPIVRLEKDSAGYFGEFNLALIPK